MLDDYRDLAKLDEGGFGQVFRAVQISTGKTVVIKKIQLTNGNQARTLREAKIHSKLSHKSIIQYIDSFIDKDHFYLVMQHANKGNLLDYIQTEPNLSLQQKLQIIKSITAGLIYLHENGILHRDLKCENVLMTETNGFLEVKLADFGASREESNEQMTLIGTPFYVSPELLQGKKYGQANDVWGLGCLMYVTLCLKLPFEENGLQVNIIHGKYRDMPRSIPSGIQELVKHIFNVNPDERPNTHVVYDIIDKFLANPEAQYIKQQSTKLDVINDKLILLHQILLCSVLILFIGIQTRTHKIGHVLIIASLAVAGTVSYLIQQLLARKKQLQ
ncbi:Kinase [Hexamita inflata]|uniref:non-specific serine/threonine protein kinase n=1 Tax=Hexamita inflata TaxID=28002 RepID=A0AA86TML7_9EUKA|nr:Kinase [Hexamita inflata]